MLQQLLLLKLSNLLFLLLKLLFLEFLLKLFLLQELLLFLLLQKLLLLLLLLDQLFLILWLVKLRRRSTHSALHYGNYPKPLGSKVSGGCQTWNFKNVNQLNIRFKSFSN